MEQGMATGLIRRNGRYSTRRVIPLELQPLYGRREIVRALGTADPKEAKRLHSIAWIRLDQEFEEARAKLAETIPSSQPQATRPNRPMSLSEWDIEQIEFGERMAAKAAHEEEAREPIGAALEAKLNGREEALSSEQLALRDLLRDARFNATVANERLAMARLGPQDGPKPASSRGQKGITLSDVIDRWKAENEPARRTVIRARNIVDRFEEVNGKLAVEAINKHHVLAFKDRLVQEGQSAPNINVMIPMLGTILNYAVDKMHVIPVNPAAKVRVTDKRRAKDKRDAFSLAALQTFFDSPVYSEGLRQVGGGGEAAYWLPLLALFTGARQTELGQLHPSDVFEETYLDAGDQQRSAWVIRITENEERGQRVKNEGSERRVPLHDALKALGFLTVVEHAKAASRPRIFHQIRPNAQGELMGNWSKWFGRYRKDHGLGARNTPFHSFRHTFKHFARASGISPEVHNEITGHETGEVADSYGGLAFPLAPLVDGMQRYRVPGLMLPAPPPEVLAVQ